MITSSIIVLYQSTQIWIICFLSNAGLPKYVIVECSGAFLQGLLLYFYYKYIISNRKIILFIGLLIVYEVSMWSDTKIKSIHTTVMNTIELYTNNMIHDFLLQCWLIVCVLLQWAVSWRAARRGSEVCYAQSRPRPRSRAAASHPWDCPHRPRHGQYNTTHYL